MAEFQFNVLVSPPPGRSLFDGLQIFAILANYREQPHPRSVVEKLDYWRRQSEAARRTDSWENRTPCWSRLEDLVAFFQASELSTRSRSSLKSEFERALFSVQMNQDMNAGAVISFKTESGLILELRLGLTESDCAGLLHRDQPNNTVFAIRGDCPHKDVVDFFQMLDNAMPEAKWWMRTSDVYSITEATYETFTNDFGVLYGSYSAALGHQTAV